MSISGKLVIAIAIAILVSIITTLAEGGPFPDIALSLALIVATCGSVLATHRPLVSQATVEAVVAPAAATPDGTRQGRATRERETKPARRDSKPAARAEQKGGKREKGEVKWFNASKGFGFITLDSGDEVFVHFRSIRGEGRRSLRDGQRVTLDVTKTDKGPQAEDVEPLE